LESAYKTSIRKIGCVAIRRVFSSKRRDPASSVESFGHLRINGGQKARLFGREGWIKQKQRCHRQPESRTPVSVRGAGLAARPCEQELALRNKSLANPRRSPLEAEWPLVTEKTGSSKRRS
jgi:hypothetical protein